MNTKTRYSMPFGRTIGFVHAHPERTASRSVSLWADTEFRVFPSREFMARMIRKQEQGPHSNRHWRAIVPLTATEGY